MRTSHPFLPATLNDGRVAAPKIMIPTMARVDAHAEMPLVFAGGITEPVESFQFIEFISLQHDDAGRAHIAYLMEGDGCNDGPERPLLLQCMYVVAEK